MLATDIMAVPKHLPGPPLTLGNMRLLGARGLAVSCLNQDGRHQAVISVDDYADEIEAPSFAARIVCSKCGGKRVEARPNWKEMPVVPGSCNTIEMLPRQLNLPQTCPWEDCNTMKK